MTILIDWHVNLSAIQMHDGPPEACVGSGTGAAGARALHNILFLMGRGYYLRRDWALRKLWLRKIRWRGIPWSDIGKRTDDRPESFGSRGGGTSGMPEPVCDCSTRMGVRKRRGESSNEAFPTGDSLRNTIPQVDIDRDRQSLHGTSARTARLDTGSENSLPVPVHTILVHSRCRFFPPTVMPSPHKEYWITITGRF